MKSACRIAAVILMLAGLFALAAPAPAPAQQAATAAPAWSPSKDIGVFVFGRNGQTPDQQLKDESECYAAAQQQTGIDPKAPAPAGKSAEEKQAEQKAAAENAEAPKGGRAKGAARGAAGGAAIGAIAGSSGTGAGAGAVAGTMRGGMKQREASAAAQKEAAAKVAAEQKAAEDRQKLAHVEGLDTFQRAFGACMDARNYSVKWEWVNAKLGILPIPDRPYVGLTTYDAKDAVAQSFNSAEERLEASMEDRQGLGVPRRPLHEI